MASCKLPPRLDLSMATFVLVRLLGYIVAAAQLAMDQARVKSGTATLAHEGGALC